MTWRDTVDSFYSNEIEQFYERGLDQVLDESLHPRGPDVLFDIAGDLGVGHASRVLDVGSRVGEQMLELRDRFACTRRRSRACDGQPRPHEAHVPERDSGGCPRDR